MAFRPEPPMSMARVMGPLAGRVDEVEDFFSGEMGVEDFGVISRNCKGRD
jgi:hypothetical protein